MPNYKENEMVTISLERYEEMKEQIEDAEEKLNNFRECFEVIDVSEGIVEVDTKDLLNAARGVLTVQVGWFYRPMDIKQMTFVNNRS